MYQKSNYSGKLKIIETGETFILYNSPYTQAYLDWEALGNSPEMVSFFPDEEFTLRLDAEKNLFYQRIDDGKLYIIHLMSYLRVRVLMDIIQESESTAIKITLKNVIDKLYHGDWELALTLLELEQSNLDSNLYDDIHLYITNYLDQYYQPFVPSLTQNSEVEFIRLSEDSTKPKPR